MLGIVKLEDWKIINRGLGRALRDMGIRGLKYWRIGVVGNCLIGILGNWSI